MRVELTHHAVDRYRSRHAPTSTWNDADATLRTLAVTARATKALTLKGQPIWEADGIRLVVKYDSRMRAHVVVTVLPPEGAEVTAEDHAIPEDLTIAEPAQPKRATEWALAQASRALKTSEDKLREATERRDRAMDAHAAAKTEWMEARERFEKAKENHDG